ncbi:TonB-dependent receptor [Parapedobacter deserti]|uniref:TonB-dependent receptor n=1 Tax=Parapedobacter deserti TaxID=1912957 RepID=A0ABV7JQR8_9SPHI
MVPRLFLPVLLTAITTVFFSPVNGQTTITGTVRDSLSKKPLKGATLQLTDGDGISVVLGFTDSIGRFSLKVPAVGSYTVRVQHLGFKRHSLPVAVNDSVQKPLDIILAMDNIMLEGVDVAAIQTVILKGDTTEFNAAAFKTEPFADSDALLTQLPGVEVDAEGNLMAQGERVARIIVDGKTFFDSDPRIAMKTLPADIIDKVQIIDEQSEQARFTGFDDGQRRKVINIVTKPDRRTGYFGRVAGGYGSTDRYTTGGNINFFGGDRRLSLTAVANNVNQQGFGMADIGAGGGGGMAMMSGGGGMMRGGRRGGGRGGPAGGGMMMGGGGTMGGIPGNTNTGSLALNYNTTWFENLEFGGDYAFNRTASLVTSVVNRETLIGDPINQISLQESHNDRLNQSHRAGFRVEYKLDSMQELTFRPNFSVQRTGGINRTAGSTMFADQVPINASDRSQENRSNNFNISGNLDYRLRLAKPGRTVSLSANGSYNSNKGLAQTLSFNEFFEDHVLGRTDTVNNLNNTSGFGNGLTGRLAYTEPLGGASRVQANYSLRTNASFSDRETMDFLAETGQFSELNRQLSNTFNNDYLHHSGGLTYQFSKEAFSFDAGMDYQGANIRNHQTFPEDQLLSHGFRSFLPNASLSYRPSRAYHVRLQYNTATNPPSINQLQNVINNEDPLNIRSGNASLAQEFQHRFNLTFTKINRETGAHLNVSANADFSNNRVVNSTFIATEDTEVAPGIVLGAGGQFTRPVNVDGYYAVRGNISWGKPIEALKLNLSLNTGLFHTHDIGLLNLQETFSNTTGINQRISVNSRISEKLLYNVTYSGNYSMVDNSNVASGDSYNYFNQTFRQDLTWIFWKGIRVNSSIMYTKNSGLSQGYNQDFFLWNASLGKKLFKGDKAELTLSVNDVLNRNTNVDRSVTELYIIDSSSNVLRQYFLLSFTYNLRHFGPGMGGFGRGMGRAS